MTRAAPPHVRDRFQGELVAHIIDAVAEAYGVSADDITGRRQNACHVRARHVMLALCAEYTGATNTTIGSYFGLDHTTVGYALQRVAWGEAENPAMAARITAARDAIRAKVPALAWQRDRTAVDAYRDTLSAADAAAQASAERQLDAILRDLRRSLMTAVRLNPGRVLAGLAAAAAEINQRGNE